MRKLAILSILVTLFLIGAPVLAQTPDITPTPDDAVYVLPAGREVVSTGILTLIGLIIALFSGLIGVAFVFVFRAAPPALQNEVMKLSEVAVSGLIKVVNAFQERAETTPTRIDDLALSEALRLIEEQRDLISQYRTELANEDAFGSERG
jgi:hypothetical protein